MSTTKESTVERMYVEEGVKDGRDDRSIRWVSGIGILFLLTFSLEVANIMLATKCDTRPEPSTALRSLLDNISRGVVGASTDGESSDLHNQTDILHRRSHRSACEPRKEFLLDQSPKRVNVCTYRGRVRVDIRQFFNDQATIRGIFLTADEFLSFSEIFPMIQVEVNRQVELMTI